MFLLLSQHAAFFSEHFRTAWPIVTEAVSGIAVTTEGLFGAELAGIQQVDLCQSPGTDSPAELKPVVTGLAIAAGRHVFVPGLVGSGSPRHPGRVNVNNGIVVIECGKKRQPGVGPFELFIGFIQRMPAAIVIKCHRHGFSLVLPEGFIVGGVIDIVTQVNHKIRVICNDMVVSDKITVGVVLAGCRDETYGFGLTG